MPGNEENKTALLILKMQNDFVYSGGAARVPGADNLVEPIAELAKKIRSAGGLVFHLLEVHSKGDGLQYALNDTVGAEVVEELDPLPGDYMIEFKSISAFKGTNLGDILAEEEVSRVIIVGLCMELEIHYTAFEAMTSGYDVDVPADYTLGEVPDAASWARNMLEERIPRRLGKG